MSRHRRARRWPRAAATGALILFAGLLVAGAVVVNIQHLKLEPVLSGSMRPGIQPGDLVIVKPVAVNQLHIDEVIAYLPPGHSTPVMHRIVSITDAGLVTKGDANREADPWGRVRPSSQSVERLVLVVPKVGFLIDIRRQLLIAAGSVLLVALATLLWLRSRMPQPSPDNSASNAPRSAGHEPKLLAQSHGEVIR